MTPEGKVKAQIRAYLKERGAYMHWSVPVGYGVPSLDILVCLAGRFIAVEVKSAKGKPTPRQLRTIKEIQEAGGTAFVAYSVEDVKNALGKYS